MFKRVILNYVMFMLNSNEPIKVAQLQKLINQSMLNGAIVIEMVNNSFSKSQKNWSLDKAKDVSILLDFAKYLSFLEVQKNSSDVDVQIRFQEEGSLF